MAERLWKTRSYVPGDVDGILALRRAVFGDLDRVRLKPEIWRWQFVDNPAGAGWVRLAERDGTIVGQYAAIPTRFRLNTAGGEERTFAMSCDTMTHPDYQRQGMFVTLAQELYAELAEQHGVATVWGFPNAASHPGFVSRLGWFDIHVFPTRAKPIRTAPVFRRYLRWGVLSRALGALADRSYQLATPRVAPPTRCEIRPLSSFDERFDALWTRHRGLAPVVQVRSSAHLNWRYCAVPEFGYRPFAVFVGGSLEGYVVVRTLTHVLSFAQLEAERDGAAFMTALLPPTHASHLTRFGFLKVPGFLNLRPWYLGARCQPADEPMLRDIDHWYVTYGDADIV
jgi:hypothetical protein